MPFPFPPSYLPQAPRATAQPQLPQRDCGPSIVLVKEWFCSWKCPSFVFYFYVASIKSIVTNNTWLKWQSTKSKPRSVGTLPASTPFYRTHTHEQVRGTLLNAKNHTAPSIHPANVQPTTQPRQANSQPTHQATTYLWSTPAEISQVWPCSAENLS